MRVPDAIETLAAANRIGKSTGPWAQSVAVATAAALERLIRVAQRDGPSEVRDYDFEHRPALAAERWAALLAKRGYLSGRHMRLAIAGPIWVASGRRRGCWKRRDSSGHGGLLVRTAATV